MVAVAVEAGKEATGLSSHVGVVVVVVIDVVFVSDCVGVVIGGG